MWDLPGPGIEPMSRALAGRFLTTAPPGKSPGPAFLNKIPGDHSDVSSTVRKTLGSEINFPAFGLVMSHSKPPKAAQKSGQDQKPALPGLVRSKLLLPP